MSFNTLKEIQDSAWKIIDDAGARKHGRVLSVTAEKQSYNDGSEAATCFTIIYRPLRRDEGSWVIANDLYDAQEALNVFKEKIDAD